MRNTTFFVFMMAMMGFITSCDDSNDPSLAQVNLKMTATSTQGTIDPNGRTTATSNLTFNEVLIGVTELEFETLEEEDDEMDDNGEEIEVDDEVEYEGVFVVDVLNGTSNPDFGIATLAPGLYEEIEMEMEPVLPGNHTISIEATFINGDTQYPVVFTSGEDFELEIENDNGFMLSEGSLVDILVVIDLDALFSGIDLTQASVDQDGTIYINSSSNASMASTIENNFEAALEAGEDEDDDDEIDD